MERSAFSALRFFVCNMARFVRISAVVIPRPRILEPFVAVVFTKGDRAEFFLKFLFEHFIFGGVFFIEFVRFRAAVMRVKINPHFPHGKLHCGKPDQHFFPVHLSAPPPINGLSSSGKIVPAQSPVIVSSYKTGCC